MDFRIVLPLWRYCLIFLPVSIFLLSACGSGKTTGSQPGHGIISRQQKLADYPKWVANPAINGCLGAVGVAKKQSGKARTQKWVAEKMAMAELSRQFEVLVTAVCKSKKKMQFSEEVLENYEERFDCTSMQKSEHLFSFYNLNPVIKESWVDPETGQMYVWVVLPAK